MKRWLEAEAIGGVPRWFILLALLTFGIATGVGQWMIFYLYPARWGMVNILAGLALAGGGLYPWLLAGEYGIWEVYEMVLSRSIRRREAEEAVAEKRAAADAKRAAAAEEAVERATAEERRAAAAAERVATAEERRAAEMAAVLEWYEQHKEQLADVPPPPGIGRNGDSNGAG